MAHTELAARPTTEQAAEPSGRQRSMLAVLLVGQFMGLLDAMRCS